MTALALPRQSAIDAPGDWLRVEDAAALMGESVRTWRYKALWEAKTARQQGRRSLARKQPTASGKGRLCWYVHRSIDKRLTRYPTTGTREDRQRPALILKYPQHKVEQAYRKARWLREWRKLCEERRGSSVTEVTLAERIVAQAREVEGDDFAISVRTLQQWQQAYQAAGSDAQIRGVETLIDHRGDRPAGGGGHDARSEQAVAYFYSVYYVERGPTKKTCHELTLRKARKEGWNWPASYAATVKWLDKYDDLALTCLFREGRQRWQHKYMPHLEIDYSLIEPGDLWVCDHHQLDLWCEHDGEQLRPWLTAIEDCRSRVIVGWYLGTVPHQDLILAAMRRAFMGWAIPQAMRIDNGKDYTSKLLTGYTKAQRDRLRAELGADWRKAMQDSEHLLDCSEHGDPRFAGIVNELGIKLIYAIPYSPWSKGTLERFFGTFEDGVSQSFATYCGRSALHKPECLEAIRRGYDKQEKSTLRKKYGREWKKVAALKLVDQSDVPTLEQVSAEIGEWIEVYHNTAHRGEGMEGRTPLAVWHTARNLRRAEPEALAFLLQVRGIYRVGRNGVCVTIGGTRVKYGAASPALYRLRGRDVLITQDPDDITCCLAWTADRENRRYIGRLEANRRISPLATNDELREASRNIQRGRKIARQAAREAVRRRHDVSAELRAMQREKLAELQARATGTDDHKPNIVPVRTGFEGVSRSVQTAPVASKSYDLTAVQAALSYGHHWDPSEEEKRRMKEEEVRRQESLRNMCGSPWRSFDDGGEKDDGTLGGLLQTESELQAEREERAYGLGMPDVSDFLSDDNRFAAFFPDEDDVSDEEAASGDTLATLAWRPGDGPLPTEEGNVQTGTEADLPTPDPSGPLAESRRE